jgi:hypothetical protein
MLRPPRAPHQFCHNRFLLRVAASLAAVNLLQSGSALLVGSATSLPAREDSGEVRRIGNLAAAVITVVLVAAGVILATMIRNRFGDLVSLAENPETRASRA